MPTTLLEILILISVILSALSFLRAKGSVKELKTGFEYLILFLLLSALVSVFVSPDFLGGLGIFRAYFIEPVLFFYCLFYTSKEFGFKYILNSLLICGLWLSLFSTLQKITGEYSLAPYEIIQGRVSAVYNSANSLALFLGPIIILTFGLFAQEIKKRRWFYFGLFLFLSATLIWTKSRGGEVALFLSLVVFTYLLLSVNSKILLKLKKVVPVICFLILVVLAINFYDNTDFIPYQGGRAYTTGDTLQIRYFIWTGTVNMLKDHPFTGAGLDGFKTLYSNQYRLPQYQEQFQYPHNILLTFWTETGIYGLFSFLLILVSALSLMLRQIYRKSPDLFLEVGLTCAFIYICLHGMVDVPYFKNDLSLEFWVLIALVVCLKKKVLV